jgi:hypothetical protein
MLRTMRHQILPVLTAVLMAVSIAVLAVLARPAFGAEAVFPKGSRIGLAPPAGFIPSSRFPGFEDAARNAAITMIALPDAAYQEFEKSAFITGAKGLTVDKREIFAFESGLGYLITGREQVQGEPVRSWYLLANSTPQLGHVAALVAVRIPEKARAAYSDAAIRAALKSVTFRVPPAEEVLGLLPFRFDDMAGFRVLSISSAGVVVLIDGDDLNKNPYMVVSIGRGAPEDAESRPRFARDLMTSAPLPDLSITSADSMRIAGGPGVEIRAEAKGADQKPVSLVQWLRFGGGTGFLRIIGIVGKDRWDEMFPRFRAVRDGVGPR